MPYDPTKQVEPTDPTDPTDTTYPTYQTEMSSAHTRERRLYSPSSFSRTRC